jgi:hypothetical protein
MRPVVATKLHFRENSGSEDDCAVRTDASDPCSATEKSVPAFFSNVEGGRDALLTQR